MADRTSLAWYAWRMAAMSPAEILHRLGEQIRRRGLRGRASGWSAFVATAEPLVEIAALTRLVRSDLPPGLERRLGECVDDVVAGKYAALGQSWPQVADGIWRDGDWFLDPVSKERWPGADMFCFDIDYRHNACFGDVKYVWEPNRLQFLQPLAVVAARRGDRHLARLAIDTVLSWMEANPPFTGIHWTSGIELSLRLVSLAIIVACVGKSMSAPEHARLQQFVIAHAFWLQRFPSLHSSANNHRVAEGLGLTVAALLAPGVCAATMATGRGILEAAAATQFFPDGVGREQSPTYAAFTLEMLCLGGRLLADTSHAFDSAWQHRVGVAARAQNALLDESGGAPRIGDDDEGRVLFCGDEPRYVASVVAAAASVAGLQECAPLRRDASLRDVLFGTGGGAAWRAPHVEHFPDGGYSVIRDTIANARTLIVFDHGPLGFGTIAAHGHADALSVWLHIDGVPVIVDSGTYLYHAGGAWRDFFRSTAAHNTLEIAGESQSIPAGAFNWRHKTRGECVRCVRADNWEVEARHDGYRRRFGVGHRRTIRRLPEGFSVEDRLTGTARALPVAIRFLLHPACTAIAGNSAILVRDEVRTLLSVTAPAGMSARIVRGAEDKIGPGWHSPCFGQRLPASCIVFEGLMHEGDTATTTFAILPS